MQALTKKDKHKILRNIYRNYLTYQDYVAGLQPGGSPDAEVIEHKGVTISFSDLKYGIKDLAPRKKEAFFYNVILDWSQRETAEQMGITTVSVGQYVDAAMEVLCRRFFADDPEYQESSRTLTTKKRRAKVNK